MPAFLRVVTWHNIDMRQQVGTNTVWEKLAGYSRAVRNGKHIWTAGTTATDDDGKIVGLGDPAGQTRFAIGKIEKAIQQLGGELKHVVRTRVYVNNMDDWEPIARAHGELFGDIRPANTMVQAKLIGEGYLVEVEAEAYIGD